MKRCGRAAKLLLAGLLCTILLLSLCYLSLKADHDCTGEHCVICRGLDASLRLLRTTAAAAAAVTVAPRLIPAILRRESAEKQICFTTPVTLRVKLLN